MARELERADIFLGSQQYGIDNRSSGVWFVQSFCQLDRAFDPRVDPRRRRAR